MSRPSTSSRRIRARREGVGAFVGTDGNVRVAGHRAGDAAFDSERRYDAPGLPMQCLEVVEACVMDGAPAALDEELPEFSWAV